MEEVEFHEKHEAIVMSGPGHGYADYSYAHPVHGTSDYKYITNISLKVDIDLDSGDEINDGDSLGTDSSDSGNKVYTSSNKYRVQSAEWSNDKEVTIGDTPKITVWLEPESSSNSNYDYRFRSSYSSGSVSVSGGTFVSASKSGSTLRW